MNPIERITITPGLCGGRPCIRGLRIRVKDVLDRLVLVRRTSWVSVCYSLTSVGADSATEA
jgi:hypothetical protein